MNTLPPRAGALALLAALTACSAKGPMLDGRPVASHADTHQITVLEAREVLELEARAALPTDAQLAELDAFGRLYRTLGHGPLLIETPENAELARGLAAQARARLIEGGVTFAALAGALAAPTPEGETETLRLSFVRYTAQAPDCPSVNEVNLARQHDNRAYGSFGCANAVNLAAMVADPADLLQPRAMDPRDGARRTVVFERYRAGTPTGAQRSNDERATIREVSQ